jgi:fatty acid desaturase
MLRNAKQHLQTVMLPLADKEDISALRSFARVMSFAFPVVFMLLLPWLFSHSTPWWPLVITGVFLLLHIGAPDKLYLPYVAWMFIASILGWLNTKLLLALIFYLLITPIGVVMKVLGKLQYKSEIQADSAWINREVSEYQKDKKRLEEPF